jgi:hypothetical protein
MAVVACVCVVTWPADLGSGDHPADPVATVVRVLTEPDVGPGGSTVRWPGPRVRVRFDLSSYPESFTADGRAALRWAAAVTGLEVVVVASGEADLVVTPGPGRGATARVRAADGVILGAVVHVGCCRRRALWEDLLQAFGPLGDHAPAGSLFSQDLSAESPASFDQWALEILYALAPASDAAAVRRCAERTAASHRNPRPLRPGVVCPLG